MNTNKRKSLFRNLIKDLIIYGEIKTTLAKAKKVQRLAEKLISKGREQTLHSRRLVAAFLQNKKAVNILVDQLAPIFKKRPGGYTRITRLRKRKGDNALLVKLELVEKPPKQKEEKEIKVKKKKKK